MQVLCDNGGKVDEGNDNENNFGVSAIDFGVWTVGVHTGHTQVRRIGIGGIEIRIKDGSRPSCDTSVSCATWK